MPLLETSEQGYISEETATGSPSIELNGQLLRVFRALIFRTDDETPLIDLPISQIRCLNAIGNDEGRKMQEIAGRLNIKLPAMSQIVERLVQRGLVERRVDPTDRRVTRLHITDEARSLIEQTRKMRLQHVTDAVERMNSDMVQRLIRDLRTLAEAGEYAHEARLGEVETGDAIHTSIEGNDPLVEMLAHRARTPRRGLTGDDASPVPDEEQE
jgi:DNA-binding MarR family transcriptional regulator